MKKYFAYKIDENIKKSLAEYYESSSLKQHSESQKLKSKIKLKRIGRLIDFKNKDIVLDVGCSSGYFLKLIKENINEGVGIDISSSIIKENKKKLLNNLSFELFDGINLNFQKKFDKILLLDVLEHVFNPDELLKSIKGALKDDGMFILQVPFTGWLSESFTKIYHEGHLRYYNPRYLRKYLNNLGFEIIKIKTYNSVPFASLLLKFKILWALFDFIINLFPSKYFPYFGEIILIAKKKI